MLALHLNLISFQVNGMPEEALESVSFAQAVANDDALKT
jgi:hypothetical protein